MAPISTRQLFVLNLPAIAILLSYFWYRRKRIGAPSDPGDKETAVETDAFIETKKSTPLDIESNSPQRSNTSSSVEDSLCSTKEATSAEDSPNKSFSRSFSAPIPIVLPKELRLSKALNISDEELDQQIEKLKSVKRTDPFSLINLGKSTNSCSVSPVRLTDLSKEDSLEDKIGENNNQKVVEEIIISPLKEEIVEEVAETPCDEVIEDIDPINQEDIEATVAPNNEEIPEETVSPCEEVVEESTTNLDIEIAPVQEEVVQKVISSEETSPQTNLVEEVEVEETQSSSNCNPLQTDCSCVEMTSTSDKEIVPNTQCVEERNEMISPVESGEAAAAAGPAQNQQPTEVMVASSAENSVSTDDMDSAGSSQGPSPSTSTGAIPKVPQGKKKKFRKLDCDLKDLGKKLKETSIGSSSEAPERRRNRGQKSRSDSGCEREETHGHSSGRESATVSPSDTMMAACGSLTSLNSSEGSNDSGKGCSDTTTPPPQPIHTFYEFLIPVDKVGKLIGKRGCFVTRVYTETNAHMVVRDHPFDTEKKICIVEGTEEAIHKAMAMVKQRFPREKLKPFIPNEEPVENRETHLPLAPGVNNETHVSCIVSPNHIFVQQPSNPSFHHFIRLHQDMGKIYVSDDVPLVPKPISANTLCVTEMAHGWSRVLVVSADNEKEVAHVKDMDYGGYAFVHFNKLKQIRKDFYYLPFQSVECYLANIEPITDVWPEEAYELMKQFTTGFYVFVHIVDFTPDEIPLVNCQVILRDGSVVWINERLVAYGFARWVNHHELLNTDVEEEEVEEQRVEEASCGL